MAITYKCPSCGAAMGFDGDTGTLHCEYCGTKVPVEEMEQTLEKEEYETLEPEGEAETEEFKVYHCSSCGAEMLAEKNTTATICSFCGAPGLLEDRLSGERRPESVLPFKVTREEAVEKFRGWTKKGLLSPKDFRSENTIEKITGFYVPYWLYDYDANVALTAHCTRVRTERRGDYRYTHTDHYQVYREVDSDFDRVPQDASEKMADGAMERTEPYDYGQLKSFQMGYLSGYLSDSYDYTSAEMAQRAKERVKRRAFEIARGTIGGYATTTVTNERIHLREKKIEYSLLPVWMLNYRYRGANYQFLVNGQSGKMVGEQPLSKGRAAGWFAGIALGLYLILTLILTFTMAGGDFHEVASPRAPEFYDFADLFTEKEEEGLLAEALAAEPSLQVQFVFMTVEDAQGKSTEKYSDDFCDDKGFGYDPAEPEGAFVMLIIDMDNREVYIKTGGSAISRIDDNDIEDILDEFFYWMPEDGESYYKAASAFLSETARVAKEVPTQESVAEKRVRLQMIFIPVCLVVAAIAIGIMILQRKTGKEVSASAYMGSSPRVVRSFDRYLHTTTVRTRIEENRSSGGSGGGGSFHTSSGGHSYGGGGRSF